MAEIKPIGGDHIVTPVLPVATTPHVHPRISPPATIISLSPVAVSLAQQGEGRKSTDQIFAEQDRKKLVGLIKRILKDENAQ